MGVVLGLLIAAAFGSGDFLGGRATKTSSAVAVLLVVQAVAVCGAAAAVALVHGDVTGRDLAFGAGAGALNSFGLGFLYQGLSTGRMGIVAPVTAVVGAVIPVGWGLAEGERPGAVVLAGVVLAVCAGALIGRERDEAEAAGALAPLLCAVLAGTGLGSSFVCFAETSSGSGMWPVLSARAASVLLVGAVALVVIRREGRFPLARLGTGRPAAAAGGFDVAANLLLVVAVRRELAVVVAPVASLAPAFTVVLAWLVLREPVGRAQAVGLAVAVAGLALIAAG